MGIACDLTIRFGSAGNSLGYLGGGWARSEPDFTWGIEAESHLVFPRVGAGDEFILTLDIIPFVHPPEVPSQRLIVSVNDTVLGSTNLSRPTLLAYRIPGALARRSDRMVVILQHPDAARPKDFAAADDDRNLAFAVSEVKLHSVTAEANGNAAVLPPGLMLAPSAEEARGVDDVAAWAASRAGLSIPEIAMRFESVGENCEFGLWQRRCDSEPLGLLRFSSTFMRNLIRGIDTGFDGLGQQEDIDPRLEGTDRKEYMIHEKRYGLVYHTFVYEGQRSVWLMREQESARLKFLRRKFMEELDGSEKIFVYKFGSSVTEEEILPLHMALNKRSPITLLWVVPARRDRPAGTVEVLMPGLLKGYIDRFAPDDNAHDLSFEGWLKVCANALVLFRLAGLARGSAGSAPAAPTGP
ncbi:MAG TPA: hypothetical protein VHB27_18050 [Rhodopila sp.]|uniref:hypothetical protein n=1 Tax=Rhodopila sp. TaxID=2480087 RepID=UPI002C2360A2|nr:hypothetical protein [Rhodopila sp.]HVY17132.1 hypothetical protein [Rhodopila sp.]